MSFDKEMVESVKEFLANVQFEVFHAFDQTGKGIEATVTVEKSNFIQGRGITVNRYYNIAGHHYVDFGALYDNEQQFEEEIEGDCRRGVSGFVDATCDVTSLRSNNSTYVYAISLDAEFKRQYRQFRKKGRVS